MSYKLTDLRHRLHQNPELSNQEFKTSEMITDIMRSFNPDKEYKVGTTGKLFVFESKIEGPVTVFRADMDALPIMEIGEVEYKSVIDGVAHMCGHDGHMTILLGLAQEISKNLPTKGKVALLFQPAEECEQGAADVVEEQVFKELSPDMVFGLHNIPGYSVNSVVIKNGTFAAASRGLIIGLNGKTSHAAEPEKGINPALAISRIINDFYLLRETGELFSDFVNLTVINIELGEIAFGTSPGHAVMRMTLRAFENDDMNLLSQKCEEIVHNICSVESLQYNLSYVEDFPATVNSSICNDLIVKAANVNDLKLLTLDKPNNWSEDFGYYTNNYSGGFFGIGAGEEHPALHNPDYDFPDEIIDTGISMFNSIYQFLNL